MVFLTYLHLCCLFSPKISHINKSALENGRKLHFFGGPPTIYLSRVKKSSLYLLAVMNDSVFKSVPLFLGHPVGFGADQ